MSLDKSRTPKLSVSSRKFVLKNKENQQNLLTGPWKFSSRGYLGPVNAAKSPEEYLGNQDAIRANLKTV